MVNLLARVKPIKIDEVHFEFRFSSVRIFNVSDFQLCGFSIFLNFDSQSFVFLISRISDFFKILIISTIVCCLKNTFFESPDVYDGLFEGVWCQTIRHRCPSA